MTEPGIYQGLTYAQYVALDGIRASDLLPMRRSPAHCREEMLHPKNSTPEEALGHAFHTFMLEPELFELQYQIAPKVDRRTKAGKAQWATWEAEHPKAILLSADERAQYEGMKAAVLANDTARELLSGGANELVAVWTDPETKALCKARLDHVGSLGGWTFITDLKTATDAREFAFKSSVAKYGYHQQLAWYRQGLNILRPAARRCCFVVVEKAPPYGVWCWELDDRALDQGLREITASLHKFVECQKAGVWPGYDQGLGLIDLPAWSVDKLDL